MDSDMLVVNPIDHALYSYSNASFAAGKSYIDMFHDLRRSFFFESFATSPSICMQLQKHFLQILLMQDLW